MRAELVLAACLVVLGAVPGCAVNLDPDPPRAGVPDDAPTLDGCLPLTDRVESLAGRLELMQLVDGSPLAIAASARFDGKDVTSGFTLGDSGAGDCLTGLTPLPARPLLDISSLGKSLVARPLGGVTTDAAYLYFAAENGLDLQTLGYGVARFEPDEQRFVGVRLLWTSDRPSYGSAAVVDGDFVYVFGGLAARFLAADAYVARAPLAGLTEPAAYEYWSGGGAFSPNADEAMPLVEAGTSPSVAYDVEHARWLMAYATPLGTELTVRSGLGVTGPWSLPVTLGGCDLPSVDDGAFCGDLTLVPLLAARGEIALTQAVGSFGRPEGATASDYWTRLVKAAWPAGLP